MAYRLAMASRADAKKITPEEGDYEIAKAFADLGAAERAEQRARIAAMDDGPSRTRITPYGQEPYFVRREVLCTTTRTGVFVDTNCN